jgi:hypothetical protein
MATVQGLDRLQREPAEAQTALSALNGEIGKIKFDPAESASVEAAVRSMKKMVDQRAGRYSSNPIVGPLISKFQRVVC